MELLKQLYMVSSPSRDEKDMFSFIKEWMGQHGIECQVYNWGITATKGLSETYPCIVAHMDEVHDRHVGKRIFETENGLLFGYDIVKGEQCGIGADDKNGIWVALKMLERLDAVKVAFFIGEEIGCIGSKQCDLGFFDDCRYVIQCDRRNGGDFITDAGVELCSKAFIRDCNIERFGYHEEHGLMTDVLELKERGLKVSAVNLSCGYYNPHTAEELTVFSQLENCLEFVEWICTNLTEVYEHEAPRRFYGRYGGGYGYGLDDWYYDPNDPYEDDYYGYGEYFGKGADKSVDNEDSAYSFIYDELCWYDQLEDCPSATDLFDEWNCCGGKGVGKKKFKKIYAQVAKDLKEFYGMPA